MSVATQEYETDPLEFVFADRLRKARRVANLSQQQVADALGVKLSRYSGWESGYNQPRELVAVSKRLADVYTDHGLNGATAEWFLGLVPSKTCLTWPHLSLVPDLDGVQGEFDFEERSPATLGVAGAATRQ